MRKKPFTLFALVTMMFLCIIILIFEGCTTSSHSSKPYARPKDARIQLRSDIVFLTATELAEKIRSGKLTSLEVVDAFLSQIYEYNPKLNAVVTVNTENARKRAREADEALSKGKIWGPLHGVPVTIKDHIATKSIRTTSGYPPLADYVPDFDATVVVRLKKAGAIILGKTNIPAVGADPQTNNPVFGKTNNPWDLERTPGGSSGGSAAAVAAGLSPLGIGVDGGGSIRIPAHFNGIFGFKPTENMVSRYGSFPAPGLPKMEFNSVRHLVCPGPLARSIDDLKLAFSIIAGPDNIDANVPAIPIIYPKPKPLKKLRIAWTDHFPGSVKVSNETRNAIKTLVEKLSAKGIMVEKINPPGFDFTSALMTVGDLMNMEVTSPSIPSYSLRLIMNISGMNAAGPDPPMVSLSYEKYLKILTRRDSLISKMEDFLSGYDAWLCPVAVTTAYKHIIPEKWRGPIPVYKNNAIIVDGKSIEYWTANTFYTVILNMTGNPVVSMPIGFTKKNLPINVQVVGPRWQDARLLTVAEQLFKAGGDFRHPPGYTKD